MGAGAWGGGHGEARVIRRRAALSAAAGHAIAAWQGVLPRRSSNRNAKTVIRHIVFFTVPDPAHLDAVLDGLSILTGIAHARRLEIGTNLRADRFDGRIDVVVYGEFDDEQALAAYHADPLYQASIDRVKPLRGERYAADYRVEEAVTEVMVDGATGSPSPTKSTT